MARPLLPVDIDPGIENWDGELRDNLDGAFTNPFTPVLVDTAGNLASSFPPANYYGCMAAVGIDGTNAAKLYFSDGTVWKEVSLL